VIEYELGVVEVCNCGNLMNRKTTFRHTRGNNEDSFYTIEIFEIFTCPACDEATLICYSTVGDTDEDGARNPDDETWELFRSYRRTVLYAPKKWLHHAIPQSIAEVTYQAQSVLSKSPRASFILCRAVLEEICNDFDIPAEGLNSKGKSRFVNLNERLTQLFKQERMSEDLIAIIQGIRELGNEGAHSDHLTFVKQAKSEDADNLLMLVNYVTERLYVDKYQQQEAEEVLSKLKGKILSVESVDNPNG
jgi:Domain of unknown function (DUF4145)